MNKTNNKKHDYNFDGGNYLRRIGASYYVCYLYYLNCNPSELRWKLVTTSESRNKLICKHTEFCKLWLEKISEMKKVYTNSMGLKVDEVNNYALELLKILNTIKFN